MTEFIAHGGAKLAVETAGHGQAVVFLHAGVADRRMWRSQLDAVAAAGWRGIAYDRRGFGETTAPEEPWSNVDDLAAVFDRFGVRDAVLVGCSMGGLVAIDFALAHPGRVRGLVLSGTAVRGSPEVERPPGFAAIQARRDAAVAEGDLDTLVALDTKVWLDGVGAPEGRVGGGARRLFADMDRIAIETGEPGGERIEPSAWERLGELDKPVLLICGELDWPGIRALHRDLVKLLPNAGTVEIADSAHLPSLDQPQRVNALLLAFLSDLPPA